MKNKKAKIKFHQYDDKYITEMHLAKSILRSYGINVEIVQKKRPMNHQTKYHVAGNSTGAYLASDLLSTLSHLKNRK